MVQPRVAMQCDDGLSETQLHILIFKDKIERLEDPPRTVDIDVKLNKKCLRKFSKVL